jgi:FKBP-type peptidyl-prolyl cis-trans isomerase
LQPSAALSANPKALSKPVLTCKIKGMDDFSYSVIKAGKGGKPGADAKVEVNYTGRLKADGKEFDSGEAAKFRVGRVIAGFAQGLQLMQPGGKYRLCIPAALGYGAEGAGDDIPANADLVFEVELLSFTTPPPKPVVPDADRTCALTTASGLGFRQIAMGSGRVATDADVALIDYVTFDARTGQILDKREWEKIPVSKATAVFSEALKMMSAGSVFTFCLPKMNIEGEETDINIRVDFLDVRAAPVIED